MNNFWHVYPREQIKPALTGNGVYALAIPEGAEASVRCFMGRSLRHDRIAGLPGVQQDTEVLAYPYGIIFSGVRSNQLEDLEEGDSLVEAAGFEVPCHNKQVISTARKLFLANPAVPRQVDPLTFCLLQGLTHLLPRFRTFPRVPIVSLPLPANQRGILIVEDCEAQLELFRLILETMGYRNVHLARDGTEALPILQAQGHEIDLIVLNWQMPRMDGLTLMRHLAHHHLHEVGVIMESGYPDNSYKREFFRLGTRSIIPIDYIVKPFSVEEFQLEIKVGMEYMRRRKARRT